MPISKKTESKLIRLVFKLSKIGTLLVTFFFVLLSEFLYILICLLAGIGIHPIGIISAFVVPAVTAYPVLWVELNVTKIIQTQNTEIELKNNLKNTLLSVVAHDVKGPLISIDSLLEFYFQEEISKEELEKMLKELQEQVKTNLDFVMNILQWTKTQFDGFQVINTPADLKNLTGKIIDAYQFQIEQKKITVETDVDVMANIDSDLMRLVLRNLISNAIKYSEAEGKIFIDSKIKNNELLTSITDNGLGIEKEKLASLFDENTLTSSRGTYRETGTGLGLKLCKSFVTAQGGRIWAESEPGKGATFYFTIPQ